MQGVDRNVAILFPSNCPAKIGMTRAAQKRGVPLKTNRMYIIQPGRQRPGWVLFVRLGRGTGRRSRHRLEAVLNEPGRVLVKGCQPWTWDGLPAVVAKSIQSVSEELRTSILSCRSVFVRPAELPPGSPRLHRSRWPASLRSVQGGLSPLRCSAAIPMACNATHSLLVMRSMEPRHQACSAGRSASGSGLGEPPTSASENPKGYSDALLAYVIALT